LDYFTARYYAGVQGRFTGADPATGWQEDPQSWNKYAYGRNNPLIYTDPSGETYQICIKGYPCVNDISDPEFYQLEQGREGFYFTGGHIYGWLSGQWTQVGTYRQLDMDLPVEVANALHTAGVRAARDTSTFMITSAMFATAYVGTYAIPAALAVLTAMGETGAVGPGVGLLNTINHIFGKAAHNLGGLVQQYGSARAAFAALEKATTAQVVAKGLTGQFEEVVNVGGTNVTVRGIAINGVVKIGTAFK
jgi:hypothetical protein